MFVHWHGKPTTTEFSIVGNPTFSSGVKQFGTHSLYLTHTDSSTYDLVNYNLSLPSTAPWTVEFWVRVSVNGFPDSGNDVYTMFSCPADSTSDGIFIGTTAQTSTTFKFDAAFNGIGVGYLGVGSDFSENIWTHVALQRASNGVYSWYADGLLVDNAASVGDNLSNSFQLGSDYPTNDNSGWAVYIDELRISNITRYSGSSFTVPTNEFSPDANTLFLAHFNNSYENAV